MKQMKNIMVLLLMITLHFINCRDDQILQKLDPSLRTELKQLNSSSQLDKRVTILFKVNETLTDLHYEILKKEDLIIKTNIGNIYTGTIPAENLYNLAKLRFIEYIQGQKKFKTKMSDKKSSMLLEKEK